MDWGLVIAIIFGISTLFLSIIAVKQARRKKPVWAYVTGKIIGLGTNAPSELKLSFNDKVINDVFQTYVTFFNAGNQAIGKEAVRANIFILFPGSQILRDPVLRTPDNPKFQLSANRCIEAGFEAIRLDFDFLDHNDGVVLDVLHTACNASIDCTGYVLEAGKPRNIGVFYPFQYIFNSKRIRSYAAGILGPLLLSGMMIFADIRAGEFPNSVTYIVLPAFIWLICLLQIVPDMVQRLKFPRWSRWQKG